MSKWKTGGSPKRMTGKTWTMVRQLRAILKQAFPIGNTEEKEVIKKMNKYQSSLLTWLVGVSFATRKL